jgi:parallel beta-helix repeat protein
MLQRFVFALLLLSSALAFSISTSSLDFYVAPTGSNSNSGSASSPWKTIQHADALAKPGWKIHVAAGTYAQGSSALVTSASGTATAHVTYISDVAGAAKITGSAADVWAAAGSYEDIVGFDVSSSGKTTNQLFQTSAPNIQLIANRVHDMINTSCLSGAGIHFGTGSSYNVALGNTVYNIGMAPSAGCNQAHGIYVSTSHNQVLNNRVFHCGDLGIHLWGAPNYNLVINNTVFGNGKGIVIGGSSSPAGNNHVANNILYKNLGVGMYETGSVGHNTIDHNLNYGNGSSWGLSGDTATSTIAKNPLFVNYTGTVSGDYHLTSVSPAIDTGTSVNAPSFDFDGVARPQGAGFDIGAYEYVHP